MSRFPRTTGKMASKIAAGIQKRLAKRGSPEVSVSLLGASLFSEPRAFVPSGILPVDLIVSRSGEGFPAGIVEIFGAEHSGKTAILERTLAHAQELGYHTALWPVEYSLDMERVKSVGVSPELLYLGEGETFEDVFEELRATVAEIREHDQEIPIVAGWDTIAATGSRSEMDHKSGLEGGDMGKAGLHLSRFFRRLKKFLFTNKVCLICLNQTRVNLGQTWGSNETTPGGKALRFYAWVRLRTRIVKILKNADDKKEGMLIGVECVKNKVAPPFRSCQLPIYWDRGIDVAEAVWLYAVDQELFTRKGTGYRYKGNVVTKRVFVAKFYGAHREEIDAELRGLA